MKELIQFRKELHQNPEVSDFETETALRVQKFIKQFPPTELLTNIGGNGIIAVYKGIEKGKTILLRCELDALPIQEINTFSHRSKTENVSHKCGHDGHMAILCGLAKEIYENPIEKGTVILLFQPAEENGNGAVAIVNEEKFKSLKPDYVFALHNLPSYDKNEIVVKNGTFTCAVNSIIVELHGKTSHAGEPEKGINPAMAISEITTAFLAKAQPDLHKENYCIITPIHINMGEKAYGVSAGYGEVHFTIRSDKNSFMENIESEFETIATKIAEAYNLKPKIYWTESFKANENNSEAVDFVRKATKKSNLTLLEKQVPFTFGEDFGLFTQQYKGAMFGLGAGKDVPALHNPDYDFPDEIIPAGISVFHNLINEVLDA